MGTAPTSQKVSDVAATPQELEATARAIYDNFNTRDLERGARLIADDCEWVDMPSGMIFRGPSGYLEFERTWLVAFSDARVEISNVVASGDLVVTEFIGRGTNDGPLMGPSGETIAPTGKKAEVRFADLMQIRGGKVVRVRSYYDALTMLRQLGVTE